MKKNKWLWAVLSLVVFVTFVGGACVLLNYQLRAIQVKKIDAIIQDNQHDNATNLTSHGMLYYLTESGATVDAAQPEWKVTYTHMFLQREWTFHFTAPRGKGIDLPN